MIYEILIATWLAFSYTDRPSFAIFDSSKAAISYVEALYVSRPEPYLQAGKVCLHQVSIKNPIKNLKLKTMNLQLHREVKIKTTEVQK